MAGKEIQFKSGNGSSNVGGDLKLIAGAGNGTNQKGGDLVLSTGTSTGNQYAAITLLTSVSGESGTDNQSPAERMRIHTNGYVGIGTNSPGTLLQLEGSEAYLTLKNTSAENGNGGAETKIIFEDHSNTSLATIQASHDGSSDDTKGDLILSTHNGTTLQEALRIESTQNTLLAGNLTTNDIIFIDDANSSHNLTLTANQSGGTNTLTLKVTTNSTFTLAANLNVEGTSAINQDLTTDNTPTFTGTTLNKADTGGDVTINFQQGGTTSYTLGIDDSDNKFKLHSHSSLQDTSDLTVDSSGNIGIGTNSPSSKLHLSSGVGANGDCELTIQTDIDNDGSYESSNPRLVLNQDSGNVMSYFSNGGNFLGIYNCAQSNGGIVFGISTAGSSTINSNTNDQNISDTTEVMRVSNDLKVGIGTSSPGTLLQLEGSDAYLTLKNTTDENTDGGAETKIIFEDHSNTSLATIQASHDGSANDTNGDLIFATHNGSSLTNAMGINSSQNVGIGTTNPIVRLEVNSSGNQLRLTYNDDTSRYADIYQKDGHFTIKTYGSGSDIILDAKGGDKQFASNGTAFGGIAENSNNLLLYSSLTAQSIIFKTSVSGSLTQILKLNKNDNLVTFDSDIKLNGSMIHSLSESNTSSSPIEINFNSTDGDFHYIISDSNSNYKLEFLTINSGNEGKKGLIIISRAAGGNSLVTINLSLENSMLGGRVWISEAGGDLTTVYNYETSKQIYNLYEYYIYSTTEVFIRQLTYSSSEYS